MRKVQLLAFLVVIVTAASAGSAAAQFGGRLSITPYIGYGFFGELPGNNGTLDADLSFGARAGYQLASQWEAYGNFQRSTPSEIDVDHWSVGVGFSYVPRGGAEGMLPILLEAGLGQARYEFGGSDFAVNIGLASALQLSPNLAIRYGANDYISNYGGGEGVVNQIFVNVGAEFRM